MDLTLTRARTRRLAVLLVALALLVGAAAVRADAGRRPTVPHDAGFESHTGVRVTRVAVVGDGGLVDVRYVVLDAQKAQKWFGDTKRPPELDNTRRHKTLYRVAAMRQGHELRPGQTYYLVYLNKGGKTRTGDSLDVGAAGDTLAAVPVQ
jgi:hypothetical protein